ncbi:ABC transporter substrate-binding protein [Desulfatitalea tepidiphila]|uniref:ABC transporter substrate-binding protein n=1 Tax=Desulfatitalea tepidiphila TaxID=1185843 RepID=UPI0006B67FC8|nr:ABC transporter substrate-binding protein [Desulfatitalea tepidiphila]
MGTISKFGTVCFVLLIVGISMFATIDTVNAAEPLKIGFIGALSTPYGASNKAALEISIDEINEEGGILGHPVKLITEDWKREVPLAVAAYKKLVMEDKCFLVFTEGTEGTTACAQVASRLYNSYPHLQFAFWTAHAGLTDLVADEYEKYKFLFRVYSSTADAYNKALDSAGFFKNTVGSEKLALLIEDIGWTEVFRKGEKGKLPTLKEYFEKEGIPVVYYAETDIKEKMFLPMLEKAAESGADTIYWLTGYSDTVTLTKQWAQSAAKDIDLILMSGASCYAAFWQMTGGQALGASSNWPQIEIPFTAQSRTLFEKMKEKKAGMLASTYGAYDGPWIVKGAAEKAGTVNDVGKLISALEKVEIQRGFWKWKFDERHEPLKGHPYHPSLIGQFQEDGKFVLVYPPELVKITNPEATYIRSKELKKRAGQ